MSVAPGMDCGGERFRFQLGLRVRQIGYTLEQQHFLAEVERRTKESWAEWRDGSGEDDLDLDAGSAQVSPA